MGKVLVLGGAGFLGFALAFSCSSSGWSVVAVGRHPPSVSQPAGVRWLTCDLHKMTQDDLDALVAPFEIIYHLAWSNLPAQAEANPCSDQVDNVGFTVRLLSAIRRSGARLIFASSGGTVYGLSGGRLLAEDDPLHPVSAYGAAKAAAELYAGLFREGYGCDVRVARLSNPFGSNQSPKRFQGALSLFARRAVAGEEVELWGDGEVVRDYLHIDDAVRGIQALAEAPRLNLGPQATFNIASGVGTSLNQLLSLLSACLGRPVTVVRRPGRRFDLAHNVLNINAAKTYLGWHPKLTLEEGIDQMLGDLTARSHRTGV